MMTVASTAIVQIPPNVQNVLKAITFKAMHVFLVVRVVLNVYLRAIALNVQAVTLKHSLLMILGVGNVSFVLSHVKHVDLQLSTANLAWMGTNYKDGNVYQKLRLDFP